MTDYTTIDKLSLLKLLLAAYEGLEAVDPHFTTRRDIMEVEQAIKELES